MDFDNYESLPPSATLGAVMTAGAIAGTMEHCIMYPLDSVKTRMQSLVPATGSYQSIVNTLTHMVKTEGTFRPVRGVSAVITGAGPAHALYFASYEKMKSTLLPAYPGQYYQSFVHGFSGGVATLFHDGVMTPADAVKQRMQMYGSPFRTCWDCIKTTYSREGGSAFYRSYTTQLSMNIPFQSLHFMVYEFFQKTLNKEGVYNPKVHVVSGAIAGAVASAVTTPLDVCKTLLNTQEGGALKSVIGTDRIKGLRYAAKTVYRIGGVRGFYRGVTARVLFQMPSTAISWSIYEFFKYFLTQAEERNPPTKELVGTKRSSQSFP